MESNDQQGNLFGCPPHTKPEYKPESCESCGAPIKWGHYRNYRPVALDDVQDARRSLVVHECERGTARARRTDPPTSHEAAAAVEGDRATVLEQKVLDVLRDWQDIRRVFSWPRGLTAWQISQRGAMEYGSVSPRLVNLERKGLVRRLPPEERAGRKRSIVWEAE